MSTGDRDRDHGDFAGFFSSEAIEAAVRIANAQQQEDDGDDDDDDGTSKNTAHPACNEHNNARLVQSVALSPSPAVRVRCPDTKGGDEPNLYDEFSKDVYMPVSRQDVDW
eukprot:CAMPEP_0194033656 /NCGR_PEP_ID=MMETSP0009_2-20130614/6259_1 /TAXON_ID=210454 /ORGANISM="Grammatophora oceanica, Strain CCMP 410" /LENGTH=109 /DNA_ID=CAMNT_0038674373 /DNA_START=82 /DNA_END=409 /DNA_ORIENTATION=-